MEEVDNRVALRRRVVIGRQIDPQSDLVVQRVRADADIDGSRPISEGKATGTRDGTANHSDEKHEYEEHARTNDIANDRQDAQAAREHDAPQSPESNNGFGRVHSESLPWTLYTASTFGSCELASAKVLGDSSSLRVSGSAEGRELSGVGHCYPARREHAGSGQTDCDDAVCA